MAGRGKAPGMTYESTPTRSRFQRILQHLRRWWWLYLIAAALLLLLILLLLFYVAVPTLGQTGVNEGQVTIQSLKATNLRPDSIHFDLSTLITSNSIFHPTIKSFNTALFLEETEPDIRPFGHITIPQLVSRKATEVQVETDMPIEDMEQFTLFLSRLVSNDSARLGLRGRPTVKLGALPAFEVDFNKVVPLIGLNGLAGFGVETFQILLSPLPDGSNVMGQARLPNPAPATIEIGTAIFDLFVKEQYIGQVKLADVLLAPGTNIFPLTGIADQLAVIRLVTTEYLNQILPVTVIPNSTFNSRGEYLPYLTDALRQRTFPLELDVGKALEDVGIQVGNRTRSMPAAAGASTPGMSAGADALLGGGGLGSLLSGLLR